MVLYLTTHSFCLNFTIKDTHTFEVWRIFNKCLFDVVMQKKGMPRPCLVGQKEEDEEEKEVDNDLLDYSLHGNFL